MMDIHETPQETVRENGVDDKPTPHASNARSAVQTPRKKSLAFYLTFIAVLINLLLYALDATTLAVATPVSPFEPT